MGVNISTTTPYHPQGNGQYERFNGAIWKTVHLLLHSHNFDIYNWKAQPLLELTTPKTLKELK